MNIKNTTRWDLSDIVRSPVDKNISRMQKKLQNNAARFSSKYKNAKPTMREGKFSDALHDINSMYNDAKSISGYAMLQYSEDTQSDAATALLASTERVSAEVENKTLFFDLWWQKDVDAKNVRRLSRVSGHMKDYLAHLHRVGKYSLSESEEKVINILDTSGQSAMVRLYDKITGGFSYSIGGRKNATREEVAALVRSPSSSKRKAAYRQILGKYGQNIGVLGDIYQNIVMRWNDVGIGMRGHDTPISVRNVANDIDGKTTSALLHVCMEKKSVFYDYFRLKARGMGSKKLERYDLYSPMSAPKREEKVGYSKAVKMVLGALGSFSPKMEGWAKSVFDSNHVDSQVRSGKRDGAFCATIRPDILPYVMLNYTGRLSDVFTMAHEMGHAVHSIAASDKPALVQEASLPLAETASTFSEMLLYESISGTISDEQKASLLAEKIADWYATIMRQSYFTLFEGSAHEMISNGCGVDEISKVYLDNLTDQFGSAVRVSDDFGAEWSCIPHFYHAPFYCYSYSFGNLLALALFRRYKEEGEGFVRQYLQILAGGGSKNPKDLLREHGIDITSKRFWHGGFDHIGEQISELRRLL